MADALGSQSAANTDQQPLIESSSRMMDELDQQPINTDGSPTSRASQEHGQRSNVIQQAAADTDAVSSDYDPNVIQTDDISPPASSTPHLSDGASEITLTASTTQYAPSSINTDASLLSHDQASARQPRQQQQKTKGRKAFEGFCYALDVLYPIDISDDVTSMSDSSIGKLRRALQEKGRAMTGKADPTPPVANNPAPEMSMS